MTRYVPEVFPVCEASVVQVYVVHFVRLDWTPLQWVRVRCGKFSLTSGDCILHVSIDTVSSASKIRRHVVYAVSWLFSSMLVARLRASCLYTGCCSLGFTSPSLQTSMFNFSAVYLTQCFLVYYYNNCNTISLQGVCQTFNYSSLLRVNPRTAKNTTLYVRFWTNC